MSHQLRRHPEEANKEENQNISHANKNKYSEQGISSTNDNQTIGATMANADLDKENDSKSIQTGYIQHYISISAIISSLIYNQTFLSNIHVTVFSLFEEQ